MRDRKGQHKNSLLIGCAVTIVFAVIVQATALSQGAALVLLGVGLALGVVGVGWAGWLVNSIYCWLSRRFSMMLRNGDRLTAGRRCLAAAAALDELLASLWQERWRGMARLARRRMERRVLAEYPRRCRSTVQDAINLAWLAAVSVPPEIARYADQPHSIAEVQWVRDWLRRVGDELSTDVRVA